jgi:hypothetical protein
MIDPESGEKCFKEFSLDLQRSFLKKYPYLDSFKWIDRMNRKLYNYIPKGVEINTKKYIPSWTTPEPVKEKTTKKGIRTLCDSCGNTYEGNLYAFDDITKEIHSPSDIINLGYIDLNVYYASAYKSAVLNRRIYREHAIRVEEIEDYIFNEEYDYLNDKNRIERLKDEYETIKKELPKTKKYTYSSWSEEDVQWWQPTRATAEPATTERAPDLVYNDATGSIVENREEIHNI